MNAGLDCLMFVIEMNARELCYRAVILLPELLEGVALLALELQAAALIMEIRRAAAIISADLILLLDARLVQIQTNAKTLLFR